MKAITPIISFITIMMITVSLAGTAYLFMNGYTDFLTSKLINVNYFASSKSNMVIIDNIGTSDIEADEIIILANGTIAKIKDPRTIKTKK